MSSFTKFDPRAFLERQGPTNTLALAGLATLAGVPVQSPNHSEVDDADGHATIHLVPQPSETPAKAAKVAKREPASLNAADIRYLYHERAAICEFDAGQDRARAESIAWNHVALHWHHQNSPPTSDDLCAGCREPLDGAPDVVLFPHGERAHADSGFDCIHRYIIRWKREAANALAAIGIPTPTEIAADIEESPYARWSPR